MQSICENTHFLNIIADESSLFQNIPSYHHDSTGFTHNVRLSAKPFYMEIINAETSFSISSLNFFRRLVLIIGQHTILCTFIFLTFLRFAFPYILPVEIPPYKLMQVLLPIIRLMQDRMIFQSVIPIPLQRPFADVQQQANILVIVQPFPVQVILRLLVAPATLSTCSSNRSIYASNVSLSNGIITPPVLSSR